MILNDNQTNKTQPFVIGGANKLKSFLINVYIYCRANFYKIFCVCERVTMTISGENVFCFRPLFFIKKAIDNENFIWYNTGIKKN